MPCFRTVVALVLGIGLAAGCGSGGGAVDGGRDAPATDAPADRDAAGGPDAVVDADAAGQADVGGDAAGDADVAVDADAAGAHDAVVETTDSAPGETLPGEAGTDTAPADALNADGSVDATVEVATPDANHSDSAAEAPADGPSGADAADGPDGMAVDAAVDAEGGTSAGKVCGTLLDLGTLPGDTSSIATAINDLGRVIGSSMTNTTRRVFRWEAGTMTLVNTYPYTPPLGTGPIDPNPSPVAINHAGLIVGSEASVGLIARAPVQWMNDQTGAALLTFQGFGSGVVTSINDAGQMLGTAQVCAPSGDCGAVNRRTHTFVWSNAASTGVDVGTLGSSAATVAGSSITVETSLGPLNQAGQAAGWSLTAAGAQHAALWSGGMLKDLGTLGGSTSAAFSIDDAATVHGTSTTAGGQTNVFKWTSGGMTDLGALPPTSSSVVAVNRAGEAIGQFSTFPASGYFWKAGTSTTLAMTPGKLNDLGEVAGIDSAKHLVVWRDGVTTDLGTIGGNVLEITAIDSAGRIIGRAKIASGAEHAFLFQPAACSN